MRKLATIRKIDNLLPIPGADAIECAVVGGWTVVVKKGEYQIGDLAVYCEIDSWIPNQIAPFLSKGKEPREFEGVKGERLRTIKLRGQLSQGLLLRMENRFDGGWLMPVTRRCWVKEGEDVTEELGIKKYEAPIPAQLSGQVKGNFPSFIPKTDQERIQNLTKELKVWQEKDYVWEVTEKLDGSSMTCYLHNGEFGVCSRNLDLKETWTEANTFWIVARRDDIEGKMRKIDEHWSFAIQGELIGEGIQKNPYKIRGHEFRVFDVFDIQTGKYLNPKARQALVQKMGLNHVPVISEVNLNGPTIDVSMLLTWAEGKSALNKDTEREGLVFKHSEATASFKAISNKFLLKNE